MDGGMDGLMEGWMRKCWPKSFSPVFLNSGCMLVIHECVQKCQQRPNKSQTPNTSIQRTVLTW